MPIILEEIWTVQTYIVMFAAGCPEQYRPCQCSFCGTDRKQHHHSHYSRTVYALMEAYLITVYRFQCSVCGKTQGLLPSFVGSHQPVAFDVQEQAVKQHSEGMSLAEIAESLTAAGSPYCEKTIWRWTSCWHERLENLGSVVWEQALKLCPHLEFPKGASKPHSEWGWLFIAWDQVKAAHPIENLLSWLYRRRFSLATAPG
jgi:hypothetical protein